MKRLLRIISIAQVLLALRVFARMARTAGGSSISADSAGPVAAGSVTVLVPVLDEADRLGPCLEALHSQGAEVAEILVIDGGSTDGTQSLVAAAGGRDGRVRLVDARPVPDRVNGKAYGLAVGVAASQPATSAFLVVDADVRMSPGAVEAIASFGQRHDLRALSVATNQRIEGQLLGIVHPSMLTTLVYRFGIPGHTVSESSNVQANGQCFFIERSLLASAGGFESVRWTIAEDVALAREIASMKIPVGFFMSDNLVEVEMHKDARDAWRNWPRSLPLRERQSALQTWSRLAECLFVQALPLPLLMANWKCLGRMSLATQIQAALFASRFGVLIGTKDAYRTRPLSYWLSPLADLPVTIEIIRRSLQRSHSWRGRTVTAGGPR